MPFGSCAACEHVDKSEENFQAQLSREGKIDYAPANQEAADTASNDDSLPEKSRLREFVKDFAKCAVRGVKCEVVDAQMGTSFSAAYFVDPPLQHLSLRQSETSETNYREVELARIQDVHDLEAAKAARQLNSSLLPDAVVRCCGDDLRDRLLVIAFDDQTPPVFILEGSSVDRDRFIMCVKILKLYAQHAPQQA
mmetsp:Transcript_92714/g.276505  ORF Transcript_92714/g.276505 Transcript_92714/m.276505 type:complete len:195 (-) Transcript_92714:143-727(-)